MSIIIPPIEKYNVLEKIIKASVNVNHPMYQIIVMLNKSSQHLNKLISEFNLVKLDAVYRMVLKSTGVIHTYRSTIDKRLSVIVADSNERSAIINLGVDVSTYPFICIFSEDYIPSSDLLLTLEPVIISNEGPNFGSITPAASIIENSASQHYIKSIYAYSNLFTFSIPSDFAFLIKKKFIVDMKGLQKNEELPDFLRRMIRSGLKLIPVAATGDSAEKKGIFISLIREHLRKIICGLRLSNLTVLINDIYYIAFLLLNFLMFYMLFTSLKNGLLYFIPILFIFVIIPLKDIMILLIENLLQKRTDNPLLIKAIFISLLKQFGVEQVISVLFLYYSFKRIAGAGR